VRDDAAHLGRLAQDVKQNIKAAAVRHAHHDVFNAKVSTLVDKRL
jgi:hypothetical protein